MSCECQYCHNHFIVDVMVPDEMWEEIKPITATERGAGLLCPVCIFRRIDKLGRYGAMRLELITWQEKHGLPPLVIRNPAPDASASSEPSPHAVGHVSHEG